MTIKTKIISLAVATVLISAVAYSTINILKIKQTSAQNIAATEARLMETKKTELKQYIEIAYSNIQEVLQNSPSEEAIAEIVARTTRLKFGDDGYFFTLSNSGVMTSHPNPKLVGKDLINLKTKSGIYHVQELIKAAQRGGGYVEYDWPKPGEEEPSVKLSYAMPIPELGWLLSTGFYVDDVEAVITQMKQEEAAHIASVITYEIVAALIIAALLTGAALVLSSTIVKPLSYVADRLNDIANKDGDLTQRLQIDSNDEIGQLATYFNQFVEKIHSVIKKTSDTANSVTNTTQQTQKLSDKITHSVENQRHQTDMVATAMNEMAASAQEVSNNASEAEASANAANSNCTEAKAVVHKSIHSVKQLVHEIDRASTVINELKGDVGNIVSVLDVIRGIAEQTNLLALNAAIEAARAGEQGRGFAVVADEVRTLASRTQDSTQEIQSMIERLQQGSDEAVDVMQSSKSVGEETVIHSTSAGESLDHIADAVGIITGMNAQIANAAREQSDVGESINKNLMEILSESDQTAEAAADSHQTTAALATQAAELNNLIRQFRV